MIDSGEGDSIQRRFIGVTPALLDFMPLWATKRKAFLITSGVIVVLFALFAVPNFVPARFESAGAPLAVRVQVTDREHGTPIQGAVVRVPSSFEEATTAEDGYCEAIARFRATGTAGRSGRMHLHGAITVTAPGYQKWERSSVSLFGATYDYFNKGTSVTCNVSLTK